MSFYIFIEDSKKNSSKLDYSPIREYPNYLEFTRTKILKPSLSKDSTKLIITSTTRRELIPKVLEKIESYIAKNNLEIVTSKYFL